MKITFIEFQSPINFENWMQKFHDILICLHPAKQTLNITYQDNVFKFITLLVLALL